MNSWISIINVWRCGKLSILQYETKIVVAWESRMRTAHILLGMLVCRYCNSCICIYVTWTQHFQHNPFHAHCIIYGEQCWSFRWGGISCGICREALKMVLWDVVSEDFNSPGVKNSRRSFYPKVPLGVSSYIFHYSQIFFCWICFENVPQVLWFSRADPENKTPWGTLGHPRDLANLSVVDQGKMAWKSSRTTYSGRD